MTLMLIYVSICCILRFSEAALEAIQHFANVFGLYGLIEQEFTEDLRIALMDVMIMGPLLKLGIKPPTVDHENDEE